MDARLQQYEDKMKKAYEYLESDYMGIRAGRANPNVLDKIKSVGKNISPDLNIDKNEAIDALLIL